VWQFTEGEAFIARCPLARGIQERDNAAINEREECRLAAGLHTNV
jgi:hypothetical protein